MKINRKVLGMLVGALAFVSCSTMGQKMADNKTKGSVIEKYTCSNGVDLRANYMPEEGKVKVTAGGYEFDMSRTSAASGAYYEGMNGSATTSFHSKAGEAIVNFGSGDISCRIVK